MTISMKPTATFTWIDGCPVRVWEGKTEGGTKVWVFVRMVAVPEDQDTGPMDAELVELVLKSNEAAEVLQWLARERQARPQPQP